MLAALLMIGTTIAAGAFAGVGFGEGDEGLGEEDLVNGQPDTDLQLLEDVDVESLVADLPETPNVQTPPVSQTEGVVTLIGEGLAGLNSLDATDNLSPIACEGGVEGFGVDWTEDPDLEAGVSDADLPEDAQVLEWTSADEPVEITDFVQGEDILSITIFVGGDTDGVDVEIGPSANGLDGEVRANDHLLAVIRGAPDIEPDAFQFDLVDPVENVVHETTLVSRMPPEMPAVLSQGGGADAVAAEDHLGEVKGNAYGHDKVHGGNGHAYGFGHDKVDGDGPDWKSKG